MAISRSRLTQTLEDALMDIAMLESEHANRGRALRELRETVLSLWDITGLPDKPEVETEVKVKVLREQAS